MTHQTLVELISRWRYEAGAAPEVLDNPAQARATQVTLRACADELEAILAGQEGAAPSPRAEGSTDAEREWAVASQFVRDIIEAIGFEQPEPQAVISLEEVRLQVVGLIEDLKAQAATEPAAQPPGTDPQASLLNPASRVYFRAGLIACREYMARFVEAQDPGIAASIRANWWPQLGQDYGPPRKLNFSEVTTGEFGTPEFRCLTVEEVSPTQEALPIALAFLDGTPTDGTEPAAQPTSVEARYMELIYAVSRKHPGESRHETALRYIRQAEQPSGDAKCAAHRKDSDV